MTGRVHSPSSSKRSSERATGMLPPEPGAVEPARGLPRAPRQDARPAGPHRVAYLPKDEEGETTVNKSCSPYGLK